MGLTTRGGSENDIAVALGLNQQCLPAVNSLTLLQLQKMVASAACFIVVELNQQFTGFVLTFLPTADYYSEHLIWFNQRFVDFLYLDRIAIADFAKRQGCGKALYADIEAYCQQRQIGNIALEVNLQPRNEASLVFHQKMGFTQVGQQTTSSGKTVALMMKAIE